MPNVLIISNNALSASRNNGKTLVSLFSKLGNVNLSQLYFRDEFPDVCPECRYFQMSERQILRSFGAHSGREVFFTQPQAVASKVSIFATIFSTLSRFQNVTLLKCVRDAIWGVGLNRDKSLDKWLKSVRPDMIFFVAGGGIFAYRIALALARTMRIPIIVYFTDDYVTYPDGGWVFRWYRRRLLSLAKEVIQQASSCFAIGEQMALEYTKKFGREFSWIMNCSSFDIPPSPAKMGRELRISYFGGLHFQRWKALSKLGNILKGLRVDGFPSNISVYSQSILTEEMQRSFNDSGVMFKGAVFGKELLKEVESSDVLLHVECDDALVVRNTRLSVSTKISEYLSSGRLVVGFGPPIVASLALLKKYNLGVVIDSSLDDESLRKLLKPLWIEELSTASIEAAANFVRTSLNPDEMRKRLLYSINLAYEEKMTN